MNACARVNIGWGIVCLTMVAGLVGCGGGDSAPYIPPGPSAGQVIGTSAEPSDDLREIAVRMGEILNLGYLTIGTEDVMRRTTGISGDDLFVVDTREPEDYAAGHIPGALNIPLQELPQALRSGSSGLPMDVDIAVASYWGGDGIFACTVINAYRIEDPANAGNYKQARSLYCGMTSWTYERSLVPVDTRFDDALAAGLNVTEDTDEGTVPGDDQGAFPEFAGFRSDAVIDKILVRADHYFNSVSDQRDLTVFASEVRDNPLAGQIVSVRGTTHYTAGHIPGAINIPWKSSTDLDNFTMFVDPDGPVVAYCYTGHSGGAATVAMGILGYDVRNLVYGMNGWSTAAPASGQLKNFDVNRGWDFPLHDWDGGLADLDGYSPDSQGCEGCHTQLTAIWMDRELDPPANIESPPDMGEG